MQVMESFTNIGPIMDMSIVDLDKQGQDLVCRMRGGGGEGGKGGVVYSVRGKCVYAIVCEVRMMGGGVRG